MVPTPDDKRIGEPMKGEEVVCSGAFPRPPKGELPPRQAKLVPLRMPKPRRVAI